MIERTLVLLKPDAVQRGLIGEIISRFEKCGIKLVGMKLAYPDEKLAGDHYADDEEWKITVGKKQKAAYEKQGVEVKETETEIGGRIRQQLMGFLSMSPIVAIVLSGHNVVKHVRKLVGETAPEHSNPGTIRGDYSFDTYNLADASERPIQNLIHASGEVDEAEREIKIWFTNEEIHDWEKLDEVLLYRGLDK